MKHRKFNLVTYFNPKSSAAESYRVLRTNLQFASVDSELKTILVTSAAPGEGKTTNISNLAVTFAQAGNKVLLIDGDLRKPRLHTVFGLKSSKGLSLAITELVNYKLNIFPCEIKNLSIMPAGPIPPNPVELLGSKSFKGLMEILKKEYDYIFIDSPPSSPFADAAVMSTSCDGVLIVVSSGMVDKQVIQYAIEQINKAKANILGIVLNNVEIKSKAYGNYYYNYIYRNEYAQSPKKRKKKGYYSKVDSRGTKKDEDNFINFMHREKEDEQVDVD